MTRLLDILSPPSALVARAHRCWPLAAVAIRLESPGPGDLPPPAGRAATGAPFELWKLRTMVAGAERMGAGLYIEAGDARITRSGRLLRRFSLDELPNLVNVLRGEMSIVGPAAHRAGAGGPLHRPTSAGGWRSSRASPAGPR